jgi:hypothetical protein
VERQCGKPVWRHSREKHQGETAAIYIVERQRRYTLWRDSVLKPFWRNGGRDNRETEKEKKISLEINIFGKFVMVVGLFFFHHEFSSHSAAVYR